MNLCEFLDKHAVEYKIIHHSPTYDAQHLAQAVAESGYHVAKTVLLKSDATNLLAVLPAAHTIDLEEVREQLNASDLTLATEEEITKRFFDCQTGAIPPFGSQYGMKTLLDKTLSETEWIVFESTTHDEAIRMRVADFLELEKPEVTHLSHPVTC